MQMLTKEKVEPKSWPLRKIPFYGAVLWALALLFFDLEGISGLARDEAAFGLYAERILSGYRPLAGYFNNYTSPLHSYLIALSFYLFGESITVLRLSGVVTNLLAVLIYFDLLRRYVPQAALSGLWLLISLPAFAMFARIAGENYALNPVLVLTGIWLWMQAMESRTPWLRGFLAAAAGGFFYLAVWNHIVALPTVASIILIYLIQQRQRWRLIGAELLWAAAGVYMAALPKLFGMFFLGHALLSAKQVHHRLMHPWDAWLNFIYTVNGAGIYVRFAGEVRNQAVVWIYALLVLGLIIVALMKMRGPLEKSLWAALVLSLAGSWLITPDYLMGSRIWLLPLWFMPAVLALAVARVPRAGLRKGILTLVVATGFCGLLLNYFIPIKQTGGQALQSVYVGGRYDGSYEMTDVRRVAAFLDACTERRVFVAGESHHRFTFLMSKARRRWVEPVTTQDLNRMPLPVGSLVVGFRNHFELKNLSLASELAPLAGYSDHNIAVFVVTGPQLSSDLDVAWEAARRLFRGSNGAIPSPRFFSLTTQKEKEQMKL